MLVNVDHIISVRTALNGRLYARMENGEEILITRRYAKEMEDLIKSYINIITEIKSIDWNEVEPKLLGKNSFSCKWCQYLGSIPNKETGFSGCKCTYDLGFRQPRNVKFNPQNWSYHLDIHAHKCKEKSNT